MSSASTAEIYPRCCFHLSPTFDNWCPLRSADIHRLKQHPGFEGQNFYFYKNLPLRWIRIVGVVVAIDEFHGRRVFTVDDSSGACIETTASYAPLPKPETSRDTTRDALNGKSKSTEALGAKNNVAATSKQPEPKVAIPFEDLDVGHVIDVKGRLTTFRDEMQIEIVRLTTLRSTAQEIALWEKRSSFRQEVLNKPWILTEKEVRSCRKKAESTKSEEDTAAKRRRRLKEAAERGFSRSVRMETASTTAEEDDSANRRRKLRAAAEEASSRSSRKEAEANTTGEDSAAKRRRRLIEAASTRSFGKKSRVKGKENRIVDHTTGINS